MFLKFSTDEIKTNGPALAQGLSFDYEPRPVIEAFKSRQLWLLGGSDRQAPNAATQDMLRQIQQERDDVAVVIYPNADHGLIERKTTANGVVMAFSAKLFDLTTDWIKDKKLPATGAMPHQAFLNALPAAAAVPPAPGGMVFMMAWAKTRQQCWLISFDSCGKRPLEAFTWQPPQAPDTEDASGENLFCGQVDPTNGSYRFTGFMGRFCGAPAKLCQRTGGPEVARLARGCTMYGFSPAWQSVQTPPGPNSISLPPAWYLPPGTLGTPIGICVPAGNGKA